MTQRFPSKVALSEKVRGQLIDDLNSVLASTIDLSLQVKQAHWNIKGPQFFARHELFDKLNIPLREHADQLAERASTLGGYAQGTVRLTVLGSRLPEYDLAAISGREHIEALVSRFAVYCRDLRERITRAEDLGDPATTDLFTQVLRNAELSLWFLESHQLGVEGTRNEGDA